MLINEKRYCCYCGKWIVWPLKLTNEHLVPISKNGNNQTRNKRPCCHICNSLRGNRPLLNFKTDLEKLININKGIAPFYNVQDLKIMVENIEYIMFYIETSGEKLIK
jgi:hypothetical protein